MSYSAKTKRDGQTDRRTDGGHCNISCPGPSAPREIKRTFRAIQVFWQFITPSSTLPGKLYAKIEKTLLNSLGANGLQLQKEQNLCYQWLQIWNMIGEFMTQLETPQTFWVFLYKMAARCHFVFPIDAKNHKVLVIWDLNGMANMNLIGVFVTKL